MPEIPICVHYAIGDFDGSKNIPHCSRYLIRLPTGKHPFSHCVACQGHWHFRKSLERMRFERNPCIYRGKQVGEESEFCCGGIEVKEPLHRCELQEKPVSLKDCSECSAQATRK